MTRPPFEHLPREDDGTTDPPSPVLVDCVVRADAAEKRGGDSVQVLEYVRNLEPLGYDLREVPFHPGMRLRHGAVVHVLNVDRPLDFLLACRAAAGHRLVVSPIHHELARVRAMRAAERGRGLRSAAGRLLPERLREWLGTAVRAGRRVRDVAGAVATTRAVAWSAPPAMRMWRAVGSALDRADAVALLAEGEGRQLRALTGWRADNAVVIPNGKPEDLDREGARPWEERAEDSIVVVGRIEPRKRQLEVARSAARLRVPVTFAGPVSDPGSAYATEFESLAATSDFVRHVGGLERREVLLLLGRSRVLLNASWVEVQSLVDLEAATMGCAVVSTPTGHSREWLGAAVVVPGGNDTDELLRAAADVAARSEAPDATAYGWTWARSSAVLAEAYSPGR